MPGRRYRRTIRKFSAPKRPFRVLQVQKTIAQLSHQRGKLADQRFAQTLEEMKKAGEILGFYRHRHLERHEGIDWVVVTSWDQVAFQVKSSIAGLRKHFQKTQDKGVCIPVVVVAPGDTTEQIKAKICKILRRRQALAEKSYSQDAKPV